MHLNASPVTKYAFDFHDRVVIEGTAFRPHSKNDVGYVFVRVDGTGVAEQFPHDLLSRLVGMGRVRREAGHFLPEEARSKMRIGAEELISARSGKHAPLVDFKLAYVQAFQALEAENVVKRTDPSIEQNLPRIRERAQHLQSERQRSTRRGYAGRKLETREAPSARSVRRWVTDYEKHGLAGLWSSWDRSGNRTPIMTAEESCLMMAAVQGCASPQRPTKQIIFENVCLSFDRANKERISAGKTPLRTPCRETVRLAVQKLDPFETEIRRSDIETARRKFAPIGVGLSDLQRPLQRVEMDAWKIDLMTLLASSGLLPHLRNEDLLWTDLDGSKGRWWLYVAICATTKCIVGMTLTRSPNAEAAVECLRMLTCDKGGWADAVGALSPWRMHGVPEHLVTDCGADFTSKRFIGALQDLKITGERAIAGMPHLRGSIERVFRTFGTKLLPRLTGRTFSNVLERAEHPTEINAALTVEDLSYALIRWVVDIYHNTPHAGLGGKTPLQCWDHVSDIYHVNPPPDLRLRRLVFGQKLTRAVDRLGIQVLGVQYHSEVLANWNLHSHSKQVRLCWLDCDVGAIEVELDGTWHTVPAVRAKLFDGQSAQSWLSVARELRASQNARREFDEQIIFAALSDINSRNLAATRQADLSTTNWSEERLSYEEARLFRGFSVVDMPDALVDVGDGLGEMVKIVPAEAIGSGVAKATNKKSQISSQSHQPLQIRSSKSTWSLE